MHFFIKLVVYSHRTCRSKGERFIWGLFPIFSYWSKFILLKVWPLFLYTFMLYSVQFSSVAQSCTTLCDSMNHSAPGFPVHHQLPEFTQTHVHRVGDAIQPISSSVVPFSSCPQSLPASESFPMSQFFAWGAPSTGVSPLASFLPKKSHLLLMYSAT